uniref:AAA+ ATPase domain-containing protein n=1 Tax=viral metagenome TaxID=1070528 RepID=A0A6C0IF56_9ZZZZ
MLNIHKSIKEKLEYFQESHKIPNIIFHGPSGCGKRTIVSEFINNIYESNREKIKSLVMYVNCAHGKGIKFIRDELKFFAKTHINSNGGDSFKSIILLNADKLTMDAQSALRRCIELFSHNTRFFIIVEDKYKLLKPILSRFCEIYVSEPEHNGKIINLYKYNLNEVFNMKEVKNIHQEWLKKELLKFVTKSTNTNINYNIDEFMKLSIKLYEKGYSGIDIINLLENSKFMDTILTLEKKYELLFAFNKVRKEFRNEKILILFILNFIFLDKELVLENISFM